MRIVGNNPQLSRQTQATASGAITGGKPVLVNTDGTVTQISETAQTIGSEAVFESATSDWINATFDSNSNKVVIGYGDGGNSGYGTAVVATIDSSDNSVSYGTPVVFVSGEVRYLSTTFDSNTNRVVMSYRNDTSSDNGFSVVGSVSGTGISFGTPVTFNSGGSSTNYIASTFDSSNNKVVIAYQDGNNSSYGTAIVGTVDSSDNSISFGSEAVFESANSQHIAITFDSSNNKVVIAYDDQGNSNYGTAIVGTVSGTSISFGTAAVFESASTDSITATFDTSNNKVFIGYRDGANSNYGTSIIGTVSGTSISFGSPVVFNSYQVIFNGATFDSNNNKVVLVFTDYSLVGSGIVRGMVIVGTISSTSVSYNTAVTFDGNTQTTYNQAVFDSSTNKILIAYHDDGNSSYGSARVFAPAVPTNITSENFIGFAEDTVATGQPVTINTKGAIDENQSSLTPAQQYFVQTDGTLGTSAGSPSVVAGTAVTATKLIVKG